MPFFDFLDDVHKLATDAFNRRKKQPTVEIPPRHPEFSLDRELLDSRQPTVQIPNEVLGDEPKSGPTPFKGMIPEDKSRFLEEQNAKASELKRRAADMLRNHHARNTLRVGAFDDAIAIIESADMNNTKKLAQIVKSALQNVGMGTTSTPGFKQLEKDNDEFNRMVYKSPVEVTPIAVDPAKLEAARAGLEKALENANVASTEEGRAFWQQQAQTQKELVKLYEQRDKGRKEEIEAAKPPPVDPELQKQNDAKLKTDQEAMRRNGAVTGDDGTPGRDSIFDVFSAVSPDGKKEFTNQARKALQKIGDKMPFIDPFSRVAFYVAMPAMAEALGAEAYKRVVSPIAMLEKERDRYAKAMQGQKEGLKEEAGQVSESRKQELDEQQRILTDLANDDVMNTPLGITAFILMSLILGPKMSAFILTRSKNRGKLQAELREVGGRLKSLDTQEEELRRMRQLADRDALEGSMKFGMAGAEAGERRESALQSRWLEHRHRMEEIRAQLGGRTKSDTTLKELDGAFDRQLRLVALSESKIATSERKIRDLHEKLSDPTTARDAKDMLKKALIEETAILEKVENERASAELKLNKIDKYIRGYGVTAGVGAESGGSGAGGEE